MTIRILTGDCRDVLRTLPDESVHCIVTSPPYFGLRDYGTAKWDGGDPACGHIDPQGPVNAPSAKSTLTTNGGKGPLPGDKYQADQKAQYRSGCGKCGARRIDRQIGLEQTPDVYVAELVGVFRECRRVLRKDGTLWLNLGDSYAQNETRHRNQHHGTETSWAKSTAQTGRKINHGLKPKDLIGIPWSVAFALRADGWYLRSDIIWAKPNPMPESVTDRPTKAHEYLFLLSKSATYYYDAAAIAEASVIGEGAVRNITPRKKGQASTRNDDDRFGVVNDGTRNKRSVWTVATQPYAEAHFATFPPDLIEPCIKAGTSEKGCCAKCGAPWNRVVERTAMVIDRSERTHEKGRTRASGTMVSPASSVTIGWSPSCSCNAAVVPCTVLDPFGGSGTTALVADRLQRNSIIIELSPEYAEMSRRRVEKDAGMFAVTEAA